MKLLLFSELVNEVLTAAHGCAADRDGDVRKPAVKCCRGPYSCLWPCHLWQGQNVVVESICWRYSYVILMEIP